MADLVGEAYIRLTVDTTAMRGAINRAAKDAGDDFVDSFVKRVNTISDQRAATVRERLARALVDPKEFDAMATKFKSVEKAADHFRAMLVKLEKQGFIKNQNAMRSYMAAVDKWERKAVKIRDTLAAQAAEQERLAKLHDEEVKRTTERDKANTQLFTNWINGLTGVKKIQVEVAAAAEKIRKTEEATATRRTQERWRALVRVFEQAERESRKLTAALEATETRRTQERWRALIRTFEDAEDEIRRLERAVLDNDRAFATYGRNVRAALERDAEPAILRLGRRIDLLGDRTAVWGSRIGRVFGAGARNNFFNLFGRTIGALISGPLRLLFEVTGKITAGFGEMIKSFRILRALGASTGSALLATLGGALKALLPLLAGFAIAIAALAFAIPTLTSAVFLLAGALTAVIGAITIGIVGALAAAAPLLLALVAGIGVMIIAFQRAGEEGTKANKAIEDLGKKWDKFTKNVKTGSNNIIVAIAGVASQLLTLFTPMVKGVQTAITTIIKEFAKGLKDPTIKGFIDNLTISIPKSLESIGRGLSNFALGILGFFSLVSPQTEDLAKGFENLSKTFLNFITQTKGTSPFRDGGEFGNFKGTKHPVIEFMETAWAAAQSLGSSLNNIVSALGKIFTSGTEGPGQDFLTWLEETTTKFDQWLSTPEGQTAVELFFKDVTDLMKNAKEALETFGEALDNFETPEGRENVKTLGDAFERIVSALEKISMLAGPVATVTLAALFPLLVLFKTLDLIGAAIESIANGIVEFFRGIASGLGEMSASTIFGSLLSLPTTIITVLMPALIGALGTTFSAAWTTVSGWMDTIRDTVRTRIMEIASRAGEWISGFATRLGDGFRLGWQTVTGWMKAIYDTVRTRVLEIRAGVGGWISGVASALVAPFITAYTLIAGWVAAIRRLFSGILGRAQTIAAGVRQSVGLGGAAAGAIVMGPQRILVGESGREAIIPLDRPLSMIDPSVRGMAALLRGGSPAMAGGGVVGGGKVVNVLPGAVVISTAVSDPTVALSVFSDALADSLAVV